jgi:NAD(P)-dependent dehydrogenase (short-subunit alcohol dehydrogenase family)
MTNLLSEKTAVVTGASSGIGRSIAQTFAEHGADVVVADVREEPREGGTPTHELIERDTDASAAYVSCDVSSLEDLKAMIDESDRFGGVDVLVNNAGIFRPEEYLEVTLDDYEQLMDVNVKGPFFGSQLAAERMIETDGGCIINVSSIAGLVGNGGYVIIASPRERSGC